MFPGGDPPGGGSDVSDQVRALPGPFRAAHLHGRDQDACPARYAMDVYRSEDGSYHVEADLPGVDPDGIEVTVEHGALTIQPNAPRTTVRASGSLSLRGRKGRSPGSSRSGHFAVPGSSGPNATSQQAGRSCGTGPGRPRQSRRLWVIERPARRGSRRGQAEENGDRSGSRVPAWPELPGPPLPLSARTIAAQGRPAPFRAAPEPGESPSPYADLGAIR
jgi:HSP20 family protein